MKIGFIGPLAPFRGGVAHFNQYLVNGMKKNGHEVIQISFKQLYPRFLFPGTSEFDPELKKNPEAHEILLAWNPFTWLQAKRILKREKVEKLFISHWHPFFSPCFSFLAMLKTLKGTALFVHNALPHEKKWLGKLLNPVLYKKASKIWIGSSLDAKNLNAMVPGIEYETVYHPLDDSFVKSIPSISKEEAKLKLGYKKDDILVSHLGLVREYKGVDILIDAFTKLYNKSILLEIAGEFYDDKSKYEILIESNNLSDRVKIIDKYLSNPDLALRLVASDLVVLPYRNATQSGIAPIVLAAGTPIIASKVGMLAEVIKDEYGEVVTPEDSDELAEAIERFFKQSNEELASRSNKIREKASQQFGDWNSYAAKLAD